MTKEAPTEQTTESHLLHTAAVNIAWGIKITYIEKTLTTHKKSSVCAVYYVKFP